MHLRSTCGDPRLVDALGRADLHHLDEGSAQGRRARSVAEVRHWIEVLWREVDDLVDEGREENDGEESEGFKDHREHMGVFSLLFDADIEVSTDDDEFTCLDQSDGSLVGFLRGIEEADLGNIGVKLAIRGEVLEESFGHWVNALGAITEQLGEASSMLARSSREAAFLDGAASETAYDRGRGLVEVHLPEWANWSRLELRPIEGSVMVRGHPVEGLQSIELVETTAMLTVDAWLVTSRVVDMTGSGGPDDMKDVAVCDVYPWYDLRFGESLLDHTRDRP
jgi:hypothetical protein